MSDPAPKSSNANSPVLRLAGLAIGSGPGAVLPALSATAQPGAPGVAFVETEETPVVASLVAAGRMVAERGRLLIDGIEDRAAVRARSALVDTPGVAEPFPVLTLRQIISEELIFADQHASPDAVSTVLEALGAQPFEHTQVQHVPTHLRIRLLSELALLRDGVDILVVTTPERHGGPIDAWFDEIWTIAQRGIAVMLITSYPISGHPLRSSPAADQSTPIGREVSGSLASTGHTLDPQE